MVHRLRGVVRDVLQAYFTRPLSIQYGELGLQRFEHWRLRPLKNLSPTVTTGPLPASRRIWHAGALHPEIRVPMREIDLHPTAGEEPVTVYDSSGPYTDPDAGIAIDRGLFRLREDWVTARGDTERYAGRHVKPADNGFAEGARLTPEFPVRHDPRRATGGRAVTQMAYARAGVVTPEMEFVAIRENLGRHAAKAALEVASPRI